MEALFNLFTSLVDVFQALLNLVVSVVLVLIPWLPLLAWLAFFSLAVNWAKAYPILRRGGILGVLLLMVVAVLVWGSVAPPEGGKHYLLGMAVSNFTGKFIYVTMLTCMALMCGSAQLSGAFGSLAVFPEAPAEDDHHGHDGHGHDGHGHDGHGHDSHGHGHDSHGHADHGHASHGHGDHGHGDHGHAVHAH